MSAVKRLLAAAENGGKQIADFAITDLIVSKLNVPVTIMKCVCFFFACLTVKSTLIDMALALY